MLNICLRYSGTVDFVLAFAADPLIPPKVYPALLTFVMDVYIYQQDVWDAVVRNFGHNDAVMRHTPVLLVYKRPGSTKVLSRVISLSVERFRLWGNPTLTNMCWVRGAQCPNGPTHIIHHTEPGGDDAEKHAYASFRCTSCDAATGLVKRPEWIHPVPARLGDVTDVYWEEWPRDTDRVKQFISTLRRNSDKMDVD